MKMANLMQVLSAPGMRKPVRRTARTMIPQSKLAQTTDHNVKGQQRHQSLCAEHYDDEEKLKLLDRWLDTVVAASGSTPALLLIVGLVITWAFLGIRFGNSENWQVLISDVQALLCYVLDSLLMRQQLNTYNGEVRIAAVMQSRSVSVRRMLQRTKGNRTDLKIPIPVLRTNQALAALGIATIQPSRINKAIDMVSDCLGHVVTLMVFWIGILIWLGFGPYCRWRVQWQLYMNSATSALMMAVFALLAYTRQQHKQRTAAYVKQICTLDACVESQLRLLTEDTMANESVTIHPPSVGRLERAISYYADLVGTLTGILLLMLVVVAWIGIGPALHFSPNWWLIIGTYAGLIGLHDGFVLHNVQSQLDRHSQVALADLVEGNRVDLAILSLGAISDSTTTSADPESQVGPEKSLTDSLGNPMANDSGLTLLIPMRLSGIMSHPLAVLVGIFFIVALLVGASALRWSTTGQLLCNVPPSIIETFVMMALITREKLDWNQKGQVLRAIGENRAILLERLQTLYHGHN